MSIANMRRSQIGFEGSGAPGVAVAPVVQLAGLLTLENQPERVLRQERRASMGGSTAYEDLSHRGRGNYAGWLYADELIYFLCSGIGTPTPVGTVWTFDQPLTRAELVAMPVRSLTAFAGEEGLETWRMARTYPERIVVSGQDRGAVTLSVDLQGNEVVTGSGATNELDLTKTTPQTAGQPNLMGKISVAATGSGTYSDWANTVFSAVWTYTTGIVLEYTMDLTLDPSAIQRDVPTATLELVAKLNATSINEYQNYHGATKRFVRVTWQAQPPGTNKVEITGCYVQTGYVPLDQERDGTLLCRLTFSAVEDLTWSSKIIAAVTGSISALPTATE